MHVPGSILCVDIRSEWVPHPGCAPSACEVTFKKCAHYYGKKAAATVSLGDTMPGCTGAWDHFKSLKRKEWLCVEQSHHGKMGRLG